MTTLAPTTTALAPTKGVNDRTLASTTAKPPDKVPPVVTAAPISGPIGPLASDTRVTCTLYGATVVIPEGWSYWPVANPPPGDSDSGHLRRFDARGPNGEFLRIDASINPTPHPPMQSVDGLESRKRGQQGVDYERLEAETTTFAGAEAARVSFLQNVTDPLQGLNGTRCECVDVFFNPTKGTPTAFYVRLPQAADQARKDRAWQIYTTFELPSA